MEKQETDRYTYMTKTPVPELITKLAIPTMISMLVTAIYNMADTYFVGKIPQNATMATAAVGLVFPLMAMIQAVGFMFGHGSGNFISRLLGAKKNDAADKTAATGFALAMILGILFSVFGNLFIGPITAFLASTDVSTDTLLMTSDYARIILIGAPFMMCQFVINNQLRFQGSAIYAMFGLLSGAAMNVILDPLLILFAGLGVTGAAVATVMGQITSFFVLLYGSSRGENIRLHIKNVRLNGYYIGQIINGGIPSLFRQGLAAVATMLLNRSAGAFGGDAAVAGMSITTRVMMLLCSALIGFGQGYQPVCSFNYGAGKGERVKEGYFFCIKKGTLFLTGVAFLCFLFAPQIIRFFRNDDAVVAVGQTALRLQAIVLPFHAVIVMTNMMLQSIGKGVKASIAASSRNGICFIPAILILPRLFGLTGVEMTQAVADICTLFISIPFALSELRTMTDAPKSY